MLDRSFSYVPIRVDTPCLPVNIGAVLAVSRGDRGVLYPPKMAAPPVLNTTRSCNPPGNAKRYHLQDSAKKLLGNAFRVKFCCRSLMKLEKTVNVIQHKNGGLSYGNVAKCGSVWVCPVCSAKISASRREELSTLVDAAVNQGYSVGMLTLTIPHGAGDDLQTILDAMCRAKRLMQNRKPWKAFAERSGLVGEVRCLEVTHGVNGFHPHFHILLFFRSSAAVVSPKATILPMWSDACLTAGLGMPNGFGCHFTMVQKHVAGYIAKFGIEWEMTYGNQTKTARKDGRTPFQLLDDYDQKDDKQAGAVFRVYASAFKGKRQLVYSKGLKHKFALPESKTDDEIMQDETDTKVVHVISSVMWENLCKRRLRGQFLDYMQRKINDPFFDSVAYLQQLFSPPPSG